MKRTATAFRSRLPLLLGATLAVASLASMAWAGAPVAAAQPQKSQEVAPPAGGLVDPHAACAHRVATTAVPQAEAGMRVYLDPETGTIGSMPPAEAMPAAPGPEPKLELVTFPDGSAMVDLKGTGQEYFILQLDAAGNRTVLCTQDPKNVTAPVAPAAPKREDR